jgi:hypothetical protein
MNGWMDDGMDDETDGWKGRPPTTSGQNFKYYISRYRTYVHHPWIRVNLNKLIIRIRRLRARIKKPHLTSNEKMQPIQWTTGALVAASSLWPAKPYLLW